MKNLLGMIFCSAIALSCQETISVDLNESPPRLVIDAKIVQPGNSENQLAHAEVQLSTTKPFFSNEETFVNNAVVKIILENGNFIPLSFTENGTYFGGISVAPDKKYTLKIIYEDEKYTAVEQLEQSVPLLYVEQFNDGGFLGENIELRAYFQDPAETENYYFLEEFSEEDGIQDVFRDLFFDGNRFYVTYISEELEPGDHVSFRLYGVDKQFYDFMSLLLKQSSNSGGSPFKTQPSTIRGNIVNETNPEHFPFGYFHISEVFVFGYTVK